jgi:hypothetical protein
VVVVDLDARLCFSYVMNRMDSGVLGDPRGYDLMEAVFDCMSA